MTSTELIPVTVREWTDILARIRFGTVKVAGKTYSAARIKLIAHRLANYADNDGTRIHPGIARLAVDLEIEYRTVRDTLSLLRRLGLLQLVHPATGRRNADEYRLTLPTDLLDRDDLEVWTPTRHATQTQKIRDTHRGTPRTTHCTQSPQTPARTRAGTATPGPQDPAPMPEPPRAARSSRTTKSSDAGSSRTTMQGPHAPTTYQDHNTTPTNQPTPKVCATVTVSRATRCVHGLTADRRGDGRPACALCRVAEYRPAVHLRTAPSPRWPASSSTGRRAWRPITEREPSSRGDGRPGPVCRPAGRALAS
ncbi:hypothetical protein [Actinoplanes subglobosus]|uniref:Helix-turn-helix domain-containing protein n=1 Tax=Actinoplanes subglobosus TaxID=1547892 RepID=A0ABV8J6L5_9ACTN